MLTLTFRTSDMTRWGAGKGSNITPAEFDLNNWELKNAIEALVSDPVQPRQIVSFTEVNGAILVTMDDGSTFGPLPLPVLAFRSRGEFQPASLYQPLDIFTDTATGLYIVLIQHTTGSFFDPDAVESGSGNPLYQLVFGISTIDVSALLDAFFGTVQGRIIYRAAAGWTALATGVDGSYLTTHGASANPTWTAPPTPTRASIAATGSAQATAAPLTSDWTIISSGLANAGVALPTASATGLPRWIFNITADDKKIYPKLGDHALINAMAADAPLTLPPNSGVELRPYTLTQWFTTS